MRGEESCFKLDSGVTENIPKAEPRPVGRGHSTVNTERQTPFERLDISFVSVSLLR